MVCSRSALALGAAVAVHLTACGARSELLGREAGELTLDCPTTLDDPRLVMLTPGDEFPLDAAQFVAGWPKFYKWSVLDDDCDGTATNRSYVLEDPTSAVATFIPGRPSPYRVRLEVAISPTDTKSCEFALPVQGRGLRVELCWSNDEEADIDLYLHSPFNQNPYLTWQAHFNDYGHESSILSDTADTCNVMNCTPVLREVSSRVNFGYAASSAAECKGGPGAQAFADLGFCPNPRLGVDNNTHGPSIVEVSGTAERLQLDNPGDGHTFRVMVRNFNDRPARPRLFVYCGGTRTPLAPPAEPVNFVGNVDSRHASAGVMWRAVDITAHHGADGRVSCDLTVLKHPADPSLPYVTIDDPSY